MYKIPSSTKKFSITNKSDTSGNIWYTKNVDFNEEGLIKLSPRTAQVFSDSSLDVSYDTDFNYTPSIGRYGSSFYLATTERPFKATLNTINFTITQDTDSGHQTLASGTRGKWFQNAWHVSNNTTVYSKAISGGAWTSRVTGLTTDISHPIEVFKSRNSLCVGNGNIVKQYDSSYANTTDLTIPIDYEVVNITFSGSRVGIITKLSATATGQNQDAHFFTWDGTSGNANSSYPINVNAIAGITPYKGSWVILSKTGQLLYYNGGGFDEIARFPFFPKDRIWDSSDMHGDALLTDGDIIYININGVLSIDGAKQEQMQANNPGGIWCYDPDVGLYHKYSPSISQLNSIVVNDSDVNTTTDLLTASSGTVPVTGSPIKLVFSTNTPIGGLTGGTIYYVIKVSPTTFRLATTKANALVGTYINLTSVGMSANYFLVLTIKDYGQSFMIATGGLVTTDTKNLVYDGLVWSTRMWNTLLETTNYVGITIPEFDNIGYFVTTRLESENVEDTYQKIYLKYKPLKSNDSIIVKYIDEEVLGIPVSTPLRANSCTWQSNTTFTLVGDLSEVLTYLAENTSNECECEIIAGSGAGQMSKISTITNNSGTYTVTLTDEIEGVTANDICHIKIENWKTLGTITSADTNNFKEFPIATSKKFIKIKTIMRGVDVTIEELQVLNKTHLKSV